EAIALDEMQMLLSRLTPAIFISLRNAVARRCNFSGSSWFRCLGMCGRGSERDCCESPNRDTQEQRPRHHFPPSSILADAVSLLLSSASLVQFKAMETTSGRTLSSLARGCQFPQSEGECHVPLPREGRWYGAVASLPTHGQLRAHRCRTPIVRLAKLSRSDITATTYVSKAWLRAGFSRL